jgi:hypothetical protein
MGTSNSYGGSDGAKPLVPSWLPDDSLPLPVAPSQPPAAIPPPASTPQILPAIPPPADPDRFTTARNNFSRFASSGGNDRASLGRAVSQYVSISSGGSGIAAKRMGASRRTSARLATFLVNAVANGTREALRSLNLEQLAGRPVEEVFLGLMEYVCPQGGTVDDGIAREAFSETVADLADNGITNFDALTADQLQTILELYVAHAIEARLCNDIGAKVITLPASITAATSVQVQLFDFIRRSVSDALSSARAGLQALTPALAMGFVAGIYEQAFNILQSMGEATGNAK